MIRIDNDFNPQDEPAGDKTTNEATIITTNDNNINKVLKKDTEKLNNYTQIDKEDINLSISIVTLKLIGLLLLNQDKSDLDNEQLQIINDLANLPINPIYTDNEKNKLLSILLRTNKLFLEPLLKQKSKDSTIIPKDSQTTLTSTLKEKKITAFTYFSVHEKPIDKFDVIKPIERLLISYENLSHLAFPNYYFEAIKEILKYSHKEDLPENIDNKIIKLPVLTLKTLIEKLIREAPSARLLQNLHRIFPSKVENSITISENEKIKEMVFNYFKSIDDYLQNNQIFSDKSMIVQSIIKNYNLGSGDIESRIPMVSFNVVKNIFPIINDEKNDELDRMVTAETIILISSLNDSMLQNTRFRQLLKTLK